MGSNFFTRLGKRTRKGYEKSNKAKARHKKVEEKKYLKELKAERKRKERIAKAVAKIRKKEGLYN